MNKEENLKKTNSNENGLSNKQVKNRQEKYGKNISKKEVNHSALYFLLNSLNDKFIYILLVLAVVNFFLSDAIGSIIIIGVSILK